MHRRYRLLVVLSVVVVATSVYACRPVRQWLQPALVAALDRGFLCLRPSKPVGDRRGKLVAAATQDRLKSKYSEATTYAFELALQL